MQGLDVLFCTICEGNVDSSLTNNVSSNAENASDFPTFAPSNFSLV